MLDIFEDQVISSMEDLRKLINQIEDKSFCCQNESWVFRGLSNSKWDLKTSFDRAIDVLKEELKENLKHFDDTEFSIEKKMIKKFIRQGQNYIDQKSNLDDWLEVLALMQHHGAPTRLMDWTYSFYIALYFAFENADNKNYSDPVVYACNCSQLNQKVIDIFSARADSRCKKISDLLYDLKRYEDYESYQTAFKNLVSKDYKTPYVYGVNPKFLNKRLTIQQGVFLFQGDVSKPFFENLEYINIYPRKYIIDRKLKAEILCMLNRMNINSVTLFPGLDGYAKSFKNLHIIYNQT